MSRQWRRLLVTLSGLVLAWLVTLLLVAWYGGRDHAQPADAIVVLGAAQYDGRPSPVLRRRLDHGIALWRRGLAPRLVVTGGRGEGDTTSEAAVGRRYALRQGVPDSVIVVEAEGRTTGESMHGVTRLLGRSARRVILVSDSYHLLRLRLVTQRVGLVPYTSPVPGAAQRGGDDWGHRASEALKLWYAAVMERGD
ncbi:MAG: YdcF family protein [Gemmatimonadetes bacterium]|nr:YdcF family protein [Gemmatimonadota bacterium]